MIFARAASRVFVLWLNCVVFYCSCLSRRGETWIPVERRFPEGLGAQTQLCASCQSGHANAAERRLPDVIRRCYRSSDPAFSYEEIPASAAPLLNTFLTDKLLL